MWLEMFYAMLIDRCIISVCVCVCELDKNVEYALNKVKT